MSKYDYDIIWSYLNKSEYLYLHVYICIHMYTYISIKHMGKVCTSDTAQTSSIPGTGLPHGWGSSTTIWPSVRTCWLVTPSGFENLGHPDISRISCFMILLCVIFFYLLIASRNADCLARKLTADKRKVIKARTCWVYCVTKYGIDIYWQN